MCAFIRVSRFSPAAPDSRSLPAFGLPPHACPARPERGRGVCVSGEARGAKSWGSRRSPSRLNPLALSLEEPRSAGRAGFFRVFICRKLSRVLTLDLDLLHNTWKSTCS